MEEDLRVLLVEDSENDAALLVRQLRKDGIRLVCERVDTPEAMRSALARGGWDVVISDYFMPEFGGLEALKVFRATGLDIPFIVVSGQIGEDDAVAAMKAGASDYIMKNSLRKLAPALERELREAQNRRDRRKAEADRHAEHEDRLLAYQRLAHLGQLAGGLAHELRNPLATISSSVFYLQSTLKNADEKTVTHLDRIRQAVDICDRNIKNLLNEARTREPNLAEQDVRAILAKAVAEAKIPDAVSVRFGFPDSPVCVATDDALISMAFRNIVKNAVEAMEGKGVLDIQVTTDRRHAVISMRDTGPGIPAENLNKIFEPLFTTKPNGVGFGLSVSSMVVGKHGGTISAESPPGQGATFIIRLPLFGVDFTTEQPEPNMSKEREGI